MIEIRFQLNIGFSPLSVRRKLAELSNHFDFICSLAGRWPVNQAESGPITLFPYAMRFCLRQPDRPLVTRRLALQVPLVQIAQPDISWSSLLKLQVPDVLPGHFPDRALLGHRLHQRFYANQAVPCDLAMES